LDVEGDPFLELVGGDELADVLDDEVAFIQILLGKEAEAFARRLIHFQYCKKIKNIFATPSSTTKFQLSFTSQ